MGCLGVAMIPIVFGLQAFWLFVAADTVVVDRSSWPTWELNAAAMAPYHRQDHDGFLDLLVKEAFRRNQINLHRVRLPAQRSLLMASAGEIDGEFSRVAGLHRGYPKLWRVDEPVLLGEFVAIGIGDVSPPESWRDFSDKHVAYIRGWKLCERNLPKNAHAEAVADEKALFRLLALGRVDFVVYERWSARYLIREMAIDNVKIAAKPVSTDSIFLFLHEKHRGKIKALEQTLRALKSEGFYDRLWQESVVLPLNDSIEAPSLAPIPKAQDAP